MHYARCTVSGARQHSTAAAHYNTVSRMVSEVHCDAWHCIVLESTASQHSTAHHSIAQRITTPHSASQYSSAQHSTLMRCCAFKIFMHAGYVYLFTGNKAVPFHPLENMCTPTAKIEALRSWLDMAYDAVQTRHPPSLYAMHPKAVQNCVARLLRKSKNQDLANSQAFLDS